jgi:hypothetical protein
MPSGAAVAGRLDAADASSRTLIDIILLVARRVAGFWRVSHRVLL